MLRPPVRDMCVDILEDLWLNRMLPVPVAQDHPNVSLDSEVRNQVQKLVQKWRPSVLAKQIKNEPEEAQQDTKMVGTNGDGTLAAEAPAPSNT